MVELTQTANLSTYGTEEDPAGGRDGDPHATVRGHRQRWASKRLMLEAGGHKHNRYRKRRKSRWSQFGLLIRFFERIIRYLNLYNRGVQNARNLEIHEVEAVLPDLPVAFHGYEILHLTDLHLDSIEGMGDIICELIHDVSCDLCVLTGDYREKTHGRFDQVLESLALIINAAKARDGALLVLGNHDTAEMAEYFDAMGARLLANETIVIQKGTDTIKITGTDDPHCYYTEQAEISLNTSGDGFKICMVHTPELNDVAAAMGYHLYLCGHTHGGQICLPGGIPIVTHSYAGRKYARGLWRFGRMTGYTSSGCGSVGIPVRFNCPSEIARIRLVGDKRYGVKVV